MFSNTPFYNQTTKKAVAVFGTLFNDIKITKPNRGTERVPIAYGPAQKFISRLNDGGGDTDRIALKVPRLSFEINSFTLDTTRQLNKNNKLIYSNQGESIFQGIPYDIGFSLTIIAKDQDSALQILEQIVPTFRPEYTIAIKDMERPGMSSDVPLILTSVAPEDTYEGTYEDRRVITYTLEFTMKIKYYGKTSAPKGIIKTIETFFHTSPEGKGVAIAHSPLSGFRISTAPGDSPDDFSPTTTFGFITPTYRADQLINDNSGSGGGGGGSGGGGDSDSSSSFVANTVHGSNNIFNAPLTVQSNATDSSAKNSLELHGNYIIGQYHSPAAHAAQTIKGDSIQLVAPTLNNLYHHNRLSDSPITDGANISLFGALPSTATRFSTHTKAFYNARAHTFRSTDKPKDILFTIDTNLSPNQSPGEATVPNSTITSFAPHTFSGTATFSNTPQFTRGIQTTQLRTELANYPAILLSSNTPSTDVNYLIKAGSVNGGAGTTAPGIKIRGGDQTGGSTHFAGPVYIDGGSPAALENSTATAGTVYIGTERAYQVIVGSKTMNGPASPVAKFIVNAPSSEFANKSTFNDTITITRSGTGTATAPQLILKDADGTNETTTIYNHSGRTAIVSRNEDAKGIIDFIQDDGTDQYTSAKISSEGLFGINTTFPRERLHVVGKILSTEGLVDRSPAEHLEPGGYSPAGIFFNSPASTDSPAMVYRAGYHQFTDNDNSPDDVLIVDFRQDHSLSARGGRVGIGTLTPQDKLQVVEKGAGQVATFHSQKNEKTDESPSFTALIDITAGTTGDGDFPAVGRIEQRRQVTDSVLPNGTKYNNSFNIIGDRFARGYGRQLAKIKLKPANIAALTAFYHSPSVRVGIANESPDVPLHISGTGSIAQNRNNFANATVQITNSPNNLYLDSNEVVSDNDLYILSTKNSGFISFAAFDSPANDTRVNIMNASATGVAIGQGTTAADEKLHVVGNAKVIGDFKSTGNVSVGQELKLQGGETADDPRIRFEASDNSNRFTIETDLDSSVANDTLTIRTNSTDDALKIKGTGDIQVGKTMQFGSYTTTERNALTGVNGMVIYNSTDDKFQGYAGGGWVNLH